MITAVPSTIAAWTGGALADTATEVAIQGVSTDTRTLAPGNLFVCLRGPHYDGHDFAHDAVAAGAGALLVERELAVAAPQVVVAHTRAALARLAVAWRSRFTIPVIAVTGSNGKTTVKECVAAILRQRGPALATRGNLNNDIGVPLMLCELDATHTAAVFELGANHPGEIATLTAWVRPDVGVLTNAGAAHLEGFGSVAGVAHAKGELLAGLPGDGHAVFPADSDWTPLWEGLAGDRRRTTFGDDDRADVHVRVQAADMLALAIDGTTAPFAFALPGAHNRRNAAAAAAGARAVGATIEQIGAGLASVEPVPGRLRQRRGPAGCALLDDSYNANPGSFAAAFAVIAEAPSPRWAVVGEMAELGAETAAAHRRLGAQAREAGIDRLWAIGPSAAETCAGFGAGADLVDDLDALVTLLHSQASAEVALLVKGSRSNALDRLVARLVPGEGG